ncbi:hypothetical protein [Streptomyces sp. NPDC059176]
MPDVSILYVTHDQLMGGVHVFEPDWNDINENLASSIEDGKSATGS